MSFANPQLATEMCEEGSEEKNATSVLCRMFKKAGKKYVCPGCLCSYVRFDLLTDHLKRAKEEEGHKGLMDEKQSTFNSSYQKSIGREPVDEGLILPSKRAAAFEIDFIVRQRISREPHHIGPKSQTLLEIALASGMRYVCPQCVDKDFQYFYNMTEYRNHCWSMGDKGHLDLQSTDSATFLPPYFKAMRRQDIRNPPLGLNRKGRRSFHECLKIDYVFQERVSVPVFFKIHGLY
jgi:hypothetical protein